MFRLFTPRADTTAELITVDVILTFMATVKIFDRGGVVGGGFGSFRGDSTSV